jgi:phosphatidylserine/phosphatidylglycerophosphate/cardiolipin synthase-like enzyme
MARKKRSGSSRQLLSVAFTILALIVLGALYLFGVDIESLLSTGEITGEGVGGGGDGGGDGGGVVVSTGGSGDYYEVYFTTPANPDEGIRTGGNDEIVVAAINGAQSTIDMAAFEFNLQSVTDALIAAQGRGVRIRMVDDNEHTEDSDQMEEIRDAGIPVVDDERSALMHNKFIVIDGRELWTGSMNFTENGVYRNNNNLLHITSPELAANYTAEFEEMFGEAAFGPRSPANTPAPRLTMGGVRIENYFSPEDDPMSHVLAQVGRADTSIHFMSFSFTHDDLGNAVRERAANGVEVRGIFEQRGANTQYSECPIMLDAGLDVRLDGNPYTFHHKVIIIDSSVLVMGSFNYSNNATESNDENMLIVHDPALAAEYEAEFNARWAETQMPFGGECLAE